MALVMAATIPTQHFPNSFFQGGFSRWPRLRFRAISIHLKTPCAYGITIRNIFFCFIVGDPSQKEAAEEKHFLQVMQRTLENDDLNDQVSHGY